MPEVSAVGAVAPAQLILWDDDPGVESPDYLAQQLVTYIGNKRALVPHIAAAVDRVKQRLGKRKLRILDAFSGSGAVSRFFKGHCCSLISNDIEAFAAVVGRCYLRNADPSAMRELGDIVQDLNRMVDVVPFKPGFIEELYAPRDEGSITIEDRVFYTRQNARRLDNYRRLIDTVPSEYHDLLLGPLISEASVHANTAGVFKGFYKDRRTGIGKFGGTNGDALARIKGEIRLELPVTSRHRCEVAVFQEDANKLVRTVRGLDLAYLDPPYNQHPYGSNYFMLNLLVDYRRPLRISKVSGIPADWQRSNYNVRSRCAHRLRDLVHSLDAPFVLVSFSSEGFISFHQIQRMLQELGRVDVIETRYNTFRGSRNLRERSIHLTERLFLLERR
ncbi:MAG: DNA adenine methylase [Armatimonadetes bacterium]|nr:DNA adenine methylase [Armatimonadota bacterium]